MDGGYANVYTHVENYRAAHRRLGHLIGCHTWVFKKGSVGLEAWLISVAKNPTEKASFHLGGVIYMATHKLFLIHRTRCSSINSEIETFSVFNMRRSRHE